MKTTEAMTMRRGKSGLGSIEYILITIVVIVLVALAWLFLSGFVGSAAVNPKAAIQSFDITVASNGEAAITLVIKNTGNVRITDVTVVGWTGGASATLAAIGSTIADPGRTITLSGTAPSGTFTLGNQYTIRVQVEYANGATEVLTAQATAHP